VRTSASKFDYGVLMIDWYPNKNGVDSNANNVYDRSGREHALLFYEQGGAVVMDFPFINNKRALSTDAYNVDEIGCCTLTVVSPLVNINGGTEAITVFVMAQFLDPQAMMPNRNNNVSFVVQSKREGSRKAENNSYSEKFQDTVGVVGKILAPVLTRAVKEVARNMRLDKPLIMAPDATPRISYWQTDFNGKGMSTTKAGSNDPEACVTTDPIVHGDEANEMDLITLACTPQMVSTVNIFSSTTPFVCAYTDRQGNINYDKWLMNLFQYHSGGIKVKVYFSCSVMHSARVVFYWGFNLTQSAWQDCYHRIVDVSGTTEVDMFLPYSEMNVLMDRSNRNWALCCSVLSFSQPVAASTSPIYMLVYQSAAEDRKYYQPLDRNYTFTPTSKKVGGDFEFKTQSHAFPRRAFREPFQSLHASMSGYEQNNIVCGEEIKSIADLMHVMWARVPVTSSNTLLYPLVPWTYGSSNVVNGVDLLNLLFLFGRGSMRLKFVTKNATPNGVMIMETTDNWICPMADMTSATVPVMDFTLPFYCPDVYFAVRSGVNPKYPCVQVNSSYTGFYFDGAGDDYSTHYIFPPPPGVFNSANSSTIGFGALRVYYG